MRRDILVGNMGGHIEKNFDLIPTLRGEILCFEAGMGLYTKKFVFYPSIPTKEGVQKVNFFV